MPEKMYKITTEPKLLPPLALAYIGDGVYELRVREYFIAHGLQKVGHLHSQTVAKVRAEEQAKLASQIEPYLTKDEMDIFKRGRNAKSGHQPPNVKVGDYRRATGLEALVGYWYLMGDENRLDWLFSILLSERDANDS
ncbi:MAG: Mini-ribonuclease 3 [Bacillota bacterium]|jgi:ribonuclease-3 family protein